MMVEIFRIKFEILRIYFKLENRYDKEIQVKKFEDFEKLEDIKMFRLIIFEFVKKLLFEK